VKRHLAFVVFSIVPIVIYYLGGDASLFLTKIGSFSIGTIVFMYVDVEDPYFVPPIDLDRTNTFAYS
jgi:hypothetical protein